MARTRQKKRVLPTAQPKEMDLVVEEGGENQQPNPMPIGEPELGPSPPKQAKMIRKAKVNTKVERTTRASVRKTESRNNINKSGSSSPQTVPETVKSKSIPNVVVTVELGDDSIAECHPEIIIPRLPSNIDQIVKKSVSIVIPSPPAPVQVSLQEPPSSPLPPPPSPPSQVRELNVTPRVSRVTAETSESPRNESIEENDSTEEVRHYMSPNDALSSTAMYATLGASQSPEILKEPLDDSSTQSTQRASAFFRSIHGKSMLISSNQTINSETSSFGITYYFIRSEEDSDDSEIMEKAYFCLVSRGFTASWITEKDVANLPQDDESIIYHFVLPSFEGTLFENLENHERWKVFSPIALLNFHSRSIPERDCPIMDVSMDRCNVTVSGFPREVRKNLEEKMLLMSAQISSSVKTRTTHIIASSWNTEKCMHSRTHGYPLVMSLRWAEFCWENMRDEVIDAFELSFDRDFRLPVFAGFIISGPNLSRRGQERLCDLVVKNGGIYEDVIDSLRTTHMVVIKREGTFYERALENERIKIVSPDWIHNSIARGYPILEEDYSMRKLMNRMVGKMMDFVGMCTKTFNDSLGGTERPSTSSDYDILVPGSPEPPEFENDDEMYSEEEPNEIA